MVPLWGMIVSWVPLMVWGFYWRNAAHAERRAARFWMRQAQDWEYLAKEIGAFRDELLNETRRR